MICSKKLIPTRRSTMGKKFIKKKAVATNVDPRMLQLAFLTQAASLARIVSPSLARDCTVTMRDVAERNVLRLDVSVKHQYCRRCSTFYVPGSNSRTRVDERKEVVRVTCQVCGTRRLRYTGAKSALHAE